MEINTNMDINAQAQQIRPEGQPERQAAQPKLHAGQTVTGEIVNITPDSITLETEDGQISASLRELPPDVKIGDTATFTAKQTESGELVLEIKQMPANAAQKAIVSDALVSSGFKASAENIKMALALLDNGLPLTKENLLRFNQTLKLMNTESGAQHIDTAENIKIDEALFMLKSNIKINPRMAGTLEKLLSGEGMLLRQLNNLAEGISKISDPALKESLISIFNEGDPVSGALKKLAGETDPSQAASKILQGFKDLSPEESRRFAADLIKMAETPEGAILKSDALLKELELGIEKHLGIQTTSKPNEISDIISDILNSKEEMFGQTGDSTKASKPEHLRPTFDGELIDGKSLNTNGDAQTMTRSENNELLKQDGTARGLSDRQLGKMRFDPQNTSPRDIETFLNELHESVLAARNELIKSPSPESTNIMKELADISNSLEFTAQLKDNLFLQLPVLVNNHETNSELFVFKDSKRKKRGGSSTALIALDTAFLDRIETYIQKEGSSINLQFRVKSNDIKDKVSLNMEKLTDQLKEHGLMLQSFQFGLLNDKFTILSNPNDLKRDQTNTATQSKGDRRIAFDVRL